MRHYDLLIWLCCALFVGVVLAPTGLYVGIWKLMTDKDAAAWVQAIGSIVAIFSSAGIAIYVDQRSAARLRKDRAKDIFFLTRAAADVVSEIIEVFDAAHAAMRDGKRLGDERFATTQKVIDRFPHERLIDPRVRKALWEAENAFVFFKPRYETYLGIEDKNSSLATEASKKMEGCKASAKASLQILTECLREMLSAA
jgi:hypothetical protein